MSLYSQPAIKIATSLGKGQTARAMQLGVRKAMDSMSLGSLGKGAAIGAGAAVARNVVQGREMFDGVGSGAVAGAVGIHAYRAGFQGSQYMNRLSKIAKMQRGGEKGTKGFRSLMAEYMGDRARVTRPIFK